MLEGAGRDWVSDFVLTDISERQLDDFHNSLFNIEVDVDSSGKEGEIS